MSNERVLELISAAADGALSDEDREELGRLLEESPEARRLHSDLERLDSFLRKVPELTPPGSLHDRIMASTSLPRVEKKQRMAMPKFAWFGSLTPSGLLRYGVATAAGVLLAAGLYESQPRIAGTPDFTDLVGTMSPSRPRAAAEIVDTYSIHEAGLEGQVSLERRDGLLLLEIAVDADTPVDISVDFASAGTRLDALMQHENPFESIEITGRTLRVRAHGRRQVTALLQPNEEAGSDRTEKINIEFSSKGKLLQRGSLTPAW